jgi:hypothetical protein
MHFLLFLDSKNVVSIVSGLEVEALSTAMANQLKFEVCFHLSIFLSLLVTSSFISPYCYSVFLQYGNLQVGNEEDNEVLEDIGSDSDEESAAEMDS